jgi:hypothetical protein
MLRDNISKEQATKTVTEAFIASEIFGIDPGAGGGIAKYSDRVETWKMPKNFDDLCDFFDYQKEICKLPLIFLEKVQLWHGDGKDKNGNEVGKQFRIQKMLNHYAELRGAIRSRGFNFIEVAPISWESYLKIRVKGEERTIRKRRFKDIAADWYPSVNVTLNTADALLLVEYGRRKLKFDSLSILRDIQKKSDKNLFR